MSRGRQVAVGRVLSFQVIVAGILGNVGLGSLPAILLLRHPDASVVAERLGHEGQLRLVVAADRDAGRVDLGVARVREERAPACRRARSAVTLQPRGVGGKVEHVAVSAGGRGRTASPACEEISPVVEVADDDALGVTVHDAPDPASRCVESIVTLPERDLPG